MSFGSRFSFVHYGNIQTSYTQSEMQELHLTLVNNRTIFYIEPAFNLQLVSTLFRGRKLI